MKIIRYQNPSTGEVEFGSVEGESVYTLPGGPESFMSPSPEKGDTPHGHGSLKILPPVWPSKIVCVGRNYLEHALELGNPVPDEPLLFLKPPSAVIGHGSAIILPTASRRVEHEGELCVVIGRTACRIPEDVDPLDYVLGYTCLNDVTARDLQKKDVQFTRAKSFDTFCPVGPYVVTGLDPSDLSVETRVNGEVRQRGRTSQMKFSVPFLVRYVSQIMTLMPGDLIATGTPSGVGPLMHGDTVEVEIERIGTLSNTVYAADRHGEVAEK